MVRQRGRGGRQGEEDVGDVIVYHEQEVKEGVEDSEHKGGDEKGEEELNCVSVTDEGGEDAIDHEGHGAATVYGTHLEGLRSV